jgi:purine-cytosine permease-like protein
VPQLIVLFVLVGSAGPKFDTTVKSIGDTATVNANRLSFLSLCLAVPVSWAAAASDFYVYYPESTTKWKIFLMTFSGIFLAYCVVNMLGVGLATGIANTPSWAAAIDVSSGALILAGYDGLGGFGKFCGVILAMGVIANNIPGTYSAALGFQMLGRYPFRVPRWLWTCIVVLIYFVCAIAGRDHLFSIFENFLALMGYWITTFISIVLEEHLWFRRKSGFDWSAWNDPSRLPLGYAALTAFLIGWAGCIIGMYQIWYEGPIAKIAGGYGADLGIWIGCGFSLITYPPLRMLELKFVGR